MSSKTGDYQGEDWLGTLKKSKLVLDDRLAYLHAEEDAKNANLGLWVEPNPIPPWEFSKAIW